MFISSTQIIKCDRSLSYKKIQFVCTLENQDFPHIKSEKIKKRGLITLHDIVFSNFITCFFLQIMPSAAWKLVMLNIVKFNGGSYVLNTN